MLQNESIQLCPSCKTGHEAYMLDSKEPLCPFLHLLGRGECHAYVEMEIEKKEA